MAPAIGVTSRYSVRDGHLHAKRRDTQEQYTWRQRPEHRGVRPGQRRTLGEEERSDRRREDRQHLRGALDAAQVRRTERVSPDGEEEDRDHASRQPYQGS